jgi:Flp pilus assembly protein TadD
MLGVALRLNGSREESLLHFTKAHTLDPGSASPCLNAGLSSRELSRIEDAVTWFRNAVRADPASEQARFLLAESLL